MKNKWWTAVACANVRVSAEHAAVQASWLIDRLCPTQLRHSLSAGSLLAPPVVRCCNNGSSCDVIDATSSSSSSSSAQQLQSTRDHLIVKVFLQTDDTHEAIMYKSILVSRRDTSPVTLFRFHSCSTFFLSTLMAFAVVGFPLAFVCMCDCLAARYLKKPLQLGSSNLTEMFYHEYWRPFLLGPKGQRSRSQARPKNSAGVGFCTLVSAGFF